MADKETERAWIDRSFQKWDAGSAPTAHKQLSELRQALIEAAMKGVREHLKTLPLTSDLVVTKTGFCVVMGSDSRVYFDTVEI